ncbi:hypothetical protein FJT64_021218 [Amphibalanus amphitrite]|uniref:Gustatory receptor n=1 Tax=Amphibalanus amphitrite TaxID=1232801 RepID=A0A6A4WYD7_AMPAM|nr:hypothetical protein FJT64_021218 [Amphibalanus amphitrite]
MIGVKEGLIWQYLPQTSLQLMNAFATVVLPCDLVQRVLDTISESRDLLLRPEWRDAEPQRELDLFRESVGRDLASLGELGLFRLQRSSMLSVAATVLTYIIVLVQFYITELSLRPEAK